MTKKLWEIFVPLKHHLNVHVLNIHGLYWKEPEKIEKWKKTKPVTNSTTQRKSRVL